MLDAIDREPVHFTSQNVVEPCSECEDALAAGVTTDTVTLSMHEGTPSIELIYLRSVPSQRTVGNSKTLPCLALPCLVSVAIYTSLVQRFSAVQRALLLIFFLEQALKREKF